MIEGVSNFLDGENAIMNLPVLHKSRLFNAIAARQDGFESIGQQFRENFIVNIAEGDGPVIFVVFRDKNDMSSTPILRNYIRVLKLGDGFQKLIETFFKVVLVLNSSIG